MKDNQKTLEEITRMLRGMLLLITKTNIECSFLLKTLVEKNVFTPDEFQRLVRELEEKMKPLMEDSAKADPNRLLDLLRSFEGPIQ